MFRKLFLDDVHVSEVRGVRRCAHAAEKFGGNPVVTREYPGFPTDMQAQMMSVLSLADGISIITEKIYPERFIHVSELSRMGARILLEGPNAIVKGVKTLSGADVMASDLRASAALTSSA